VGTALCDHSLDNYAFFDPNLGCTKLHHNPAPFIRGFMPLTTLAIKIIVFNQIGWIKQVIGKSH